MFGNVFEFDGEGDSWVFKGQLQDPDVVTEQEDGLVSIPIFDRLQQIQDQVDAGISYDINKLFTGTFGASPQVAGTLEESNLPYFYYFYSSDRLVKFMPELSVGMDKKFRIEVNSESIIRRLLSLQCRGPKGSDGLEGDAGSDGVPANNELFRQPLNQTSTEFEFSGFVASPIDTDISFRLFQDKVQIIEITVPLSPTSPIGVIDTDEFVVSLSDTIIEYEPSANVLSGVVVLSTGTFDEGEWEWKGRQVGPKGEDGEDGDDFLELVTEFNGDPNVAFKQAIISLRKSEFRSNLFFLKQELFTKVCVPNVKATAGAIPVGDATESNLVALEQTSSSCKNIGFFKFSPEEFAPDLVLPQFTPGKQCLDRRRFDIANFDWASESEPALPFDIFLDPRPEETCCQEPFFFCPNLGDACEVLGRPIVPEPGDPPSSSSTSTSSEGSSNSDNGSETG